jgi:hypothetical protein
MCPCRKPLLSHLERPVWRTTTTSSCSRLAVAEADGKAADEAPASHRLPLLRTASCEQSMGLYEPAPILVHLVHEGQSILPSRCDWRTLDSNMGVCDGGGYGKVAALLGAPPPATNASPPCRLSHCAT